MKNIHSQHNGIALLIAIVLVGVFLGVGSALLSVTLKQFQLSNILLSSEIAFQAANAGMECAVHKDFKDKAFDIATSGIPVAREATLTCAGYTDADGDSAPTSVDGVVSGEEQLFEFSWGTSPAVCTQFSVYKFYNDTNPVPLKINGIDIRPTKSCPAKAVCTVVQSRGYNVTCGLIGTNSNVVEREYTQIY